MQPSRSLKFTVRGNTRERRFKRNPPERLLRSMDDSGGERFTSFALARQCKNIFVRRRQKRLINVRGTRRWRLLCQYLNGSRINRRRMKGKEWTELGTLGGDFSWTVTLATPSHPFPNGLPTICWPNVRNVRRFDLASQFYRHVTALRALWEFGDIGLPSSRRICFECVRIVKTVPTPTLLDV